MSVLDDVFREEYERLQRIRSVMEKELNEIPKGYLSKKSIGGKQYYYLQKRVDGKVTSQFVPKCDIESWERNISRRRKLEASLRECRNNIRKLERFI